MKTYFLNFVLLSLFVGFALESLHSQRNNVWMMGYDHPSVSLPTGPMEINFAGPNPTITLIQDTADLDECNASIADTSGNLLFYTNGLDIRDKNFNIIQNGDSLNYGDLWEEFYTAGLPLRQGAIILPFPEHPNEYYLIHNTLKDILAGNYLPTEVLYSKIDMSLNQGLGAVVSKNQELLVLDKGDAAITACRHGNGRDWWLLFPIRASNCYERFLLTPNGLENQGQDCIVGMDFEAVWEAKYSQDGKKYARFQDSTIHIMDFDRCSGLYSNLLTIPVHHSQDSTTGGGVEFSPNSRYLYINNAAYAYQFDMLASDIAGSRITVAVMDGLPDPYFPGGFLGMALAPNGKIYSNGGGVLSVPVIQYPDSAGLSCHYEQHGFVLPRFNNTIPNFPNYNLGPAYGSGCDSFTTSTTAFVSSKQVKVYPNPVQDVVHIEIPQNAQNAIFSLLDLSGKEVLIASLQGSISKVQVGKLPKGVYIYTVSFNGGREYGKVLVE